MINEEKMNDTELDFYTNTFYYNHDKFYLL